MRCPSCGEPQSSRTKRRGFVQTVVLPLLGYFPWECASCRFQHLSRQRGVRRHRSQTLNEPLDGDKTLQEEAG